MSGRGSKNSSKEGPELDNPAMSHRSAAGEKREGYVWQKVNRHRHREQREAQQDKCLSGLCGAAAVEHAADLTPMSGPETPNYQSQSENLTLQRVHVYKEDDEENDYEEDEETDRFYSDVSDTEADPPPVHTEDFDEAHILDLQRRLAAYMDDLGDIISLDLDEQGEQFFINLELVRHGYKHAEPNYPRGQEVKCECSICLDVLKLRRRLCCNFPACDACMTQYLETQVTQGIVRIPCISGSCEAHVYRDEVLGRLSSTMKDRYYKFLVDANKDPKIKTCPRCSNIYKIEELGSTDHGKYGTLVTCPECELDWCFECHAPWHQEVKCKEFRRGDKLLKMWAKEHHYGHNNAQKCPKCKVRLRRGFKHCVLIKTLQHFLFRTYSQ